MDGRNGWCPDEETRAASTRCPSTCAVGWSGYGDGTVDCTSFVFMHESGHILGGTHVTDSPTSPETLANHQCKLLGFIPIGPTGPSLMSYASGTRTCCFAVPPASGTPKRNLTMVAEYLHGALR